MRQRERRKPDTVGTWLLLVLLAFAVVTAIARLTEWDVIYVDPAAPCEEAGGAYVDGSCLDPSVLIEP